MGLLGSLLFGDSGSSNSTWTKSDWDQEIMRLNNRLADAKLDLQRTKMQLKGVKDKAWVAYQLSFPQERVEKLKAQIANAKIQRQSAPK